MINLFVGLFVALSSSTFATVLNVNKFYDTNLYSSIGNGKISQSECDKYSTIDNLSSCSLKEVRHESIVRYEMLRDRMWIKGQGYCYNMYTDGEFQNHKPRFVNDLYSRKDNSLEALKFLQNLGYSKTFICLEFEKLREILIDEIVEKIEDKEIHVFKNLSIESNILGNADFDRSYNDVCGKNGSTEARIKDCSIYPKSDYGDLKLLTRSKSGEKLYYNTKQKTYWSDNVYKSESFDNQVPHLWRLATADEKSQLSASNREIFKYISAPSIQGEIEPFISTLKNRKTNEIIEFNYRDGIAILYLINPSGERTLLRKISLIKSPKGHFSNRSMYDDFDNVYAISRGYGDLTEGLMKTMDFGYLVLFPVTLSAYGVYTLAYVPAYFLDLFGAEKKAVRKVNKVLSGISTKTGDKSFNIALKIFKGAKLD